MAEITTTRGEGGKAASGRDVIELQAYWRAVWRRRWLVVPFFVALVLATAVVSLRLAKTYDATCTIIIDLQAPRVLEKEQVQDVVESGTGGYWYSREYYETQYKVITSRAVAQRVVDKLHLASNLRWLDLEDVQDPAELEKRRARRDPVQLLQKHLRVEPVKDSRVVRIRYEDGDAQLAAQIANAVADAYIAENLSVKSVTTASATDWLEAQLADLEKKLEGSGKALFDFKRSHDIVATTWEDRQSMVTQRLTAINEALTRARVKKAELQARNDSVAALGDALAKGLSGPEVESLSAVAGSVGVQSLKLRFFEAQSECADLRVKYLEQHPRIEACDRKLTMARQALKDEMQATLSAARKEYQEVVRTERNLQALLDQAKGDAFDLNQYERDYLELKRTYDNNQRLYELVLKRLKDTGVAGMLQVSNVRVLDRARPALKAISPDVPRNLALAVLLGLLGGLGLALGAEYLDRSINGQEEIEERLGLAFLGVVPSFERRKDGTTSDLTAFEEPKSAVAECLRAVRTNLLFMSPEKPLRTILVTSSGPQEGKTTTATSLAITMAGSGNRVLLVDGDMRRPRVHRIFGASSSTGLSSLILGEGKLEDVVRPTSVPNLSILPCGPVPPNPAELLHASSFARLVAEMAERYDRIIIDSPPVGVVADAIVIATNVDGTLLVFKAGHTTRDVAAQAVRQLRDVKAPIFGAVLNHLDLHSQRYGQYAYYYQYGYYYGERAGDSGAGGAPRPG